MKKFLYILIFIYLFIITPTTVHAETLIWFDDFNYSGSGIERRNRLQGNWSIDDSVGVTTALCGTSGPNCVKLASTQNVPGDGVTAGDGWINNSFTVTPGATYRARVSAGVYSTGSSPDGRVTIIMGDGISSTRSSCTQGTCPASDSQYSTELSVTFTPQTDRVTVWLEGTQGGCINFPSGCHDAGADDFRFYKADPAPVTIGGRVTNSSNTGISGVNISVYNRRLDQTRSGSNYPSLITQPDGSFWIDNFVIRNDDYAVYPPSTAPSGYINSPNPSAWNTQKAGGTQDCGPNCSFTYTTSSPDDPEQAAKSCPVTDSCCYQPLQNCNTNNDCPTNYKWCYFNNLDNRSYCIKENYSTSTRTCSNNICNAGEREWDGSLCSSRSCNNGGTAWGSWGLRCSDFGTEAFNPESSSCNCAVACKDIVSPFQHPACFPNVSVSCSASPTATTPNKAVTWTAQISGGTPPFNFRWSQDVSDTGTISSYTFAKDTKYTAVGTKTAQIDITDAAGKPATNTCTATITNALSASCSPSNQTVASGTTTTVNAQASGGSRTYSSYTWSGDTTGSTTGQSINVQYTTSATVTKQVRVSVTDSSGTQSGLSPFCNITVTPPGAQGSLSLNIPTSSCTTTTPPTPYIDLSWTPSNATFNSYQIFRRKQGDTNPTSIYTALGSQTTYRDRDANIVSGSTYTYSIRGTTTTSQIIDSNPSAIMAANCAGTPTCSLSANPASGTGPFSSTISVTYANLTSAPGTIAVDCGNGSGSSASGCGGRSGSCSATCSYAQITPPAPAATYTATVSSPANCSTNITNNPSGSGPDLQPWIQTTDGDVHSNTRIDTPGGPE